MSSLRVYCKHYANNTQHPVVTFPAACPAEYKLLHGNGMADQVLCDRQRETSASET